MLDVLFWSVTAIVLAECSGYWLHRLLHSGKIDYLSSSHMIHHMRIYGPKMPMLDRRYHLAVKHRHAILGIGMEWIVPGLILYGIILSALLLLHVAWSFVILFALLSFSYIWVFYNYLHDAMHIDGFWLEKTLLKRWFAQRRVWHFLHHTELSDDGRMFLNFGITFVVLDRAFGTFGSQKKAFNEAGFSAAEKRYAPILDKFDRRLD